MTSAAKAGTISARDRTSFHAQAPMRLSTNFSAAASPLGDSQSSAAPVEVGAQVPLAIQRAPSRHGRGESARQRKKSDEPRQEPHRRRRPHNLGQRPIAPTAALSTPSACARAAKGLCASLARE